MDDSSALVHELREIRKQLATIAVTLTMLESDVNELKQSSRKMNHHISLVEGVYSSVRSPLDFLRRRLGVFKVDSEPLPLLPQKTVEHEQTLTLPSTSHERDTV